MSGIYFHIPFCKQACHYCDFHFSTSLRRKQEMVQALGKELVMRKYEITDRVDTVYFGGGTPSLLRDKELAWLLELIRQNYELNENAEITLEANPDDLSADKLKELSSSGVNRLSIGVQSFFEEDLVYMNRAHNATEAIKSVETARGLFDNISIDLIYGIPGMSEQRWLRNLSLTFELEIPHISSYALTVEPRTALDHFIKKGTYQAPEDKLMERHFNLLQHEAKNNGYIQYEISNFGKRGWFSKHNSSYWYGISYLGVGPSAHSFDGNKRSSNVSNNAKYLSAIKSNTFDREIEFLEPEDRINESIMTGLRTIWGVSLSEIESKFGEKYKIKVLKQAAHHLEAGRLYIAANHMFLPPEKYFLADGISADLFLLKV